MQTKRNYFLWMFFAATFFSACKKDDPQMESGAPLFHASGTLNGQPFLLEAGVNNYYMYSSCPSDLNNIYEYTGELKKVGSTSPSPSSFAVHIRDYRAHTLSATSPDSALAPGIYNFVNATNPQLTVGFNAQLFPGDSLLSATWSFGGTGAHPTFTYGTTGNYYVTLSASVFHNSSTQFTTVDDSVFVGPPFHPMSIDFTPVNMDVVNQGGDSMQFNATASGGTSPYTYNWDFGDGNSGIIGNNLIHSYAIAQDYAVHLLVVDALGQQQWKTRNVVAPHSDSTAINFNWQQIGNTDFSLVTIEWTDANGNVYSSSGGQQPGSSSFQIISEENYDANENHEATKKVHLRVDCTLFNGSNTILLQNADIIFAVAHH